MKKIILVLLVVLLTLLSASSAFAITGPPPPPPKGRNCADVVVDEEFNALYPPPMGLTTFAACWATPAVQEVCFSKPYGGYNFHIRYWQWDKGRWHGGVWTTNKIPTTYSQGEYCVKPVPGLQLYAIQGIAIGPGTWWTGPGEWSETNPDDWTWPGDWWWSGPGEWGWWSLPEAPIE